MKWTTLVSRELTRRYRAADIHGAIFLPKGWAGRGPIITLTIPECISLRYRPWTDNEIIVYPRGRNLSFWLRRVCKEAESARAAIIFSCNTPEQAEDAAKAAAGLLPGHERVALERACGKAAVRARLS
jgi:hypothetical protein